jgi:hypothetical protein
MKIIILLLISLLPSIASAQDQANPNQCHFRVMAWENAISDLFLSQVAPPLPDPQYPDKSLPPDPNFVEKSIFIPFKFRSAFALCDKTKPLYFFRHVGALYKVVATVDLSDAADFPLLFFQDSTHVSVIPDDTQSFPSGAVRLLNLSSIPVTFYFDHTSIQLDPKTNKLYVPPKSGKVMFLQLVRDTDRKCEYSNSWSTSSDRTILFITDDKNTPKFYRLAESMKATVPEGELPQYK